MASVYPASWDSTGRRGSIWDVKHVPKASQHLNLVPVRSQTVPCPSVWQASTSMPPPMFAPCVPEDLTNLMINKLSVSHVIQTQPPREREPQMPMNVPTDARSVANIVLINYQYLIFCSRLEREKLNCVIKMPFVTSTKPITRK